MCQHPQSAPRWVIRERFHHKLVGAPSFLHACDPRSHWEEWPGTRQVRCPLDTLSAGGTGGAGAGSDGKQVGWGMMKHTKPYLQKLQHTHTYSLFLRSAPGGTRWHIFWCSLVVGTEHSQYCFAAVILYLFSSNAGYNRSIIKLIMFTKLLYGAFLPIFKICQ